MCSNSLTVAGVVRTVGAKRKGNKLPPLLLSSIVALALALLLRSIPSISTCVRAISAIAAGIIGFLGSIVLFVNYYANSFLRKASTTTAHVSALTKKVPPPEGAVEDLDKITHPGGLSKLWKDEIQANENTFRILLTGVTGYVGKAFLFQLLREIAKAEEEGSKKLPHKVYVMARGNTRKNLTAGQRLLTIRDEPIFAPYKKQWDHVVVAAQSGNLQEKNCGMSEEVLTMLSDAQLTHVVHCAADVNFTRPLPESSGINISPALQLQALAASWPSCTRFVHCSTAFVHPGPGTDEEPVPEALFPLGKYDPQDLYDSMRGDQKLALQAKEEFGFPNNYVLTKCVAEHLVVRNNDSSKIELRICRPAVVGPAWVLPEQGWNGDKPSTISGVFLLWGTRVIRFAPLLKTPMPVIPVDVVAAGIIHAMIAPPAETKNKEFPVSFRNLIWSHNSPVPFAGGLPMAKENVATGMFLRHFSATESAVSFMLLDIFDAYPSSFAILHTIFNLGPLYLLQFVCWTMKMTGIKTVLDQVPVVKLFKFSDMLDLYRPYMGREYKFESSLNVPKTLDMHRYSAGLMVATHGFWTKMFPGTIQGLDVVDILPNGRFDLWWSLTHPCGSLKTRITCYLACKILRASCAAAMVDLSTVEEIFTTMVKLEETMTEKKHCVVLAPTHKSVIDYVLVKYVIFFMASMGVDVPEVIAKKEFNDSKLTEKLGKTVSKFDRHISLAAFFEGPPSADGCIQKPLAGALEKIVKMKGPDDFTLVPMSLGYKSLCENELVLEATQKSSDIDLYGMLTLYWKICMMDKTKRGSLGDVMIKYGTPVSLDSSSDLAAAAAELHEQLRSLGSSTR